MIRDPRQMFDASAGILMGSVAMGNKRLPARRLPDLLRRPEASVIATNEREASQEPYSAAAA
jgi:hypothetical protein